MQFVAVFVAILAVVSAQFGGQFGGYQGIAGFQYSSPVALQRDARANTGNRDFALFLSYFFYLYSSW